MLGKPPILSLFPTRLINSIKHEHSCKILYVILPAGQGPQVREPGVLTHSTLGAKEQPPLLKAHSFISTQENPLPL